MRRSVNLLPTREQSVDCCERIVRTAPYRIPRCGHWCRSRRSRSEPDKLFEGPVEWIEYPIESNSHLKCESPSRDVIRWSRRPTGIGNVVGMILRLEHVDGMRSERLRSFYDVRARRIIFPGDGKRASPALNVDSILHPTIHQIHPRREIPLGK